MPDQSVEAVARILTERYADHDHYNRRNPLEELIYIICSTQTAEQGYRGTFGELRRTFPTFEALAVAEVDDLAGPLRQAGCSGRSRRRCAITSMRSCAGLASSRSPTCAACRTARSRRSSPR
ncbi:MAG: hypothetical protein R3F11_29720 [Verrucomicrobiales bacterium]